MATIALPRLATSSDETTKQRPSSQSQYRPRLAGGSPSSLKPVPEWAQAASARRVTRQERVLVARPPHTSRCRGVQQPRGLSLLPDERLLTDRPHTSEEAVKKPVGRGADDVEWAAEHWWSVDSWATHNKAMQMGSQPHSQSPITPDAISLELGVPQMVIPTLRGFDEIFKVIEARERTVQTLRGFLASLGYIRGNARLLPVESQRRARGKLARLLARVRTLTTITVELIQMWRCTIVKAKDDGVVSSYAATHLSEDEKLVGCVTDFVATHAELRATSTARNAATYKLATTMGHKAAGTALPTFYWMGFNYLLKMATDLAFLPIPVCKGTSQSMMYRKAAY